MKILALETATDACSVALWLDGVIYEDFRLAPREHTKLLLPMLDQLMANAQLRPQQLDAIALGCGPGSFTGVRIAAGVAHGIAFGADLPIVPVSTLAALAQDFFQHNPQANVAFTAMDARMDEIFWGVYGKNAVGIAESLQAEAVTPAMAIRFPDVDGYGVGSGFNVYLDILQQCLTSHLSGVADIIYPRAGAVVALGAYGFSHGQMVAVEQALPVYLRNKVAKTQAERAAEKLLK